MEQQYKVFDKGFNKILDLIQDADPQLINRFKLLLRYIPQEIIDTLEKCEDVEFRCEGYNFEMLRTENTLNIEFNIGSDKILKNQLFIRRLFEEDLLSEEEEIKIFSLYQRNTKEKMPVWVFEDQDGELRPKEDSQGNKAKEIGIDVYINKDEGSFNFVKYTDVRGLILREEKHSFDLTDMFEYLEIEDEYEEELEAYLELDDDFNNRLNGSN